MQLQLLALCLLTLLGSTLSQGREDVAPRRVKRGGRGPSVHVDRRQLSGDGTADIGGEPGQISFSIPFLKALGLPQPVVLQAYQQQRRRRVDAVVPSLVSTLRSLTEQAEPVTTRIRQAVDSHIAPGLAAVGRTAVDGLAAGVSAVLGQERFSRVGETVGALGTIAKAVMRGEDEEQALLQQQQQYQEEQERYQFQSIDEQYHPEYGVDPRRQQLQPRPPQSMQEAFYVLGRNILGANVTDRLLPVVKQVAEGFGKVGDGLSTITDALPLPAVEFDSGGVRLKTVEQPPQAVQQQQQQQAARDERNAEAQQSPVAAVAQQQAEIDAGRITSKSAPKCTTPQKGEGRCMDIQNCPLLLGNLDMLRKSICFKSLFVPGVCCPENGVQLAVVDENLNVVNEVQEIQPPQQEHGTSPEAASQSPIIGPQLPSLSEIFTSSSSSAPPPSFEKADNKVPGTDLECGVTQIPQARIVGGNETFEGEYPWMAAIYLHGKDKREFWCGGALITPNHVITAAHCTRDAKKRPFRPNQFTVRVGEWDLKDNDSYSEEFRVVDYKAHPDFRPNGFYNDVSVFTLDQPVRFSAHIQPICLPSGRNLKRDFVSTLPVALGWGTTHYGGEEVGKLRGVPLPVWPNKECDDAYFQPITEVFLCAGYPDGKRDACQGDSGGPLMLYDDDTQSWMLIGIVSFGNRCAEPGYPGVYTRITHFIQFIESIIL